MLTGFIRRAAVLLCLLGVLATPQPALAQSLNEYTVELPAGLSADHTLCQVSIVIQDTGVYAATMLHEAAEPLSDGGALESRRDDMLYRTWIAERGGKRTLVLQTTASNIFNVEAGFCKAPAEASSAGIDFFPVNARLTGGSPDEADPKGPYDGIAELVVEFCGIDDGMDVLAELERIVGDALSGSGASYVVNSFHSNDRGRSRYRFRLADHPRSLRELAEAIRPGLEAINEVSIIIGNRVMLVSGCDRKGLWIIVEGEGKTLWTDEFSGLRLLAARQDAGNIFITYAGGSNNIHLNIAHAAGPGSYAIAAAPGDDDDPKRITYAIAHHGGTVSTPYVVKSTSGTVRLTAVDARAGVSGLFRFAARDEDGKARTVWGGFQDIPLR